MNEDMREVQLGPDILIELLQMLLPRPKPKILHQIGAEHLIERPGIIRIPMI